MNSQRLIKNSFIVLLLLFLVMFQSPKTSASVTADGFSYEIVDGEAFITGYSGPGGDVILPAEINGTPVTTLKHGAINFRLGVTSLTISENIKEIYPSAIHGLYSATAYHVVPENQFFTAVDGVLYSMDGTIIIAYPSKKAGSSYIVPTGVTSVANAAFFETSFLDEVTLPDGLLSIGINAFTNSNISIITLPSTITSIGHVSFSDTNLSTIKLPPLLTSIPFQAFSFCNNLVHVEVPSGVTDIGEKAFGYCTNLQRVYLPSSVTAISPDSFIDCNDLTLYVEKNSYAHQYAQSEGIAFVIGEYQIATDISIEPTATIADYYRLEVTALPEGSVPPALRWSSSNPSIATVDGTGVVTKVSEGDCIITVSMVEDASVSASCELSVRSFSVTLDNATKTATVHGYSGRYQTDMVIPPTINGYPVTTISGLAFYKRTGLTGSLTLPDSLTSIGREAFRMSGFNGNLKLGSGLKSIGVMAFEDCKFTGGLTLPNSLVEVGDSAFSQCSGFTGGLNIPSGLKIINNSAFSGRVKML